MRLAKKTVLILVLSVSAMSVFVGGFHAGSDLSAQQPTVKSDAGPSSELKKIARLVAANELMRLHWTNWVTDAEHAKIVKETAQGINEDFSNQWKFEFLAPITKKERKLNEFEESALVDIRAGQAEVWRQLSDQVQYLRGVRAKASCVRCHTTLLKSKEMKLEEGDLLGVVSVKLPK